MKITTVATAIATTDRMPTFSSAHPSERVRGISARAFLRCPRAAPAAVPCAAALRQEGLQIWIPRALQLASGSLEDDAAVLQHDELGLLGLLLICRLDLHAGRRAE